ncbi:hypothetical protein [Neisseria sp. Ec49-e6-T10]|uniref:hypothetical protein n=1 Tax=Neisseria sp. Ec49-e6-T10 TaxID=3140744 RepID=UPI003EC15231
MEQNPYQAPSSDLVSTQPSLDKPSIDEAIERGYDFSIGDILSQASKKMNGMKLTYWLALIVYSAITIPISLIAAFIPGLNYVVGFLLAPLAAGLYFITLNHLRGKEISVSQLFERCVSKECFMPIVIAAALTTLFYILGLLLFIIPGIYLIVAYLLHQFIIFDNPGISFWEAMEASRKTITQHWFKVFFLIFLLALINMGGAMLLMIGLIWTVPLTAMTTAILYETIFGPRA